MIDSNICTKCFVLHILIEIILDVMHYLLLCNKIIKGKHTQVLERDHILPIVQNPPPPPPPSSSLRLKTSPPLKQSCKVRNVDIGYPIIKTDTNNINWKLSQKSRKTQKAEEIHLLMRLVDDTLLVTQHDEKGNTLCVLTKQKMCVFVDHKFKRISNGLCFAYAPGVLS